MPDQTVIVFVPGYKGSLLKDMSSDKRVWISFKDIFSSLKPLSIQNYPNLYAEGPLKKFSFGPLDLRIFYDPFFTYFKDKVDIKVFSYDWRLSPLEHLEPFHQFLEGIKKTYQRIILVAHSLGGYWVSYYLRFGIQHPNIAQETWQGLNKVSSIVFAGVPFKGTLTAFEEICHGERLVLNTTLLDRFATQSFPVGYFLLPSWEGTSFFEEEIWDQYNKFLLNIGKITLKEHLNVGKKFSDFIHLPSKHPTSIQKPLLRIFGSQTPTQSSLNPKHYSKGDGTVLVHSSELPQAFESFSFSQVDAGSKKHVHLLSDPQVLKAIEAVL